MSVSESPCHTRYVIQNSKQPILFQAHRTTAWDTFEHARVWARKADAERATFEGPWKKKIKNAVVVPVTVALGAPYAIFTEGI